MTNQIEQRNHKLELQNAHFKSLLDQKDRLISVLGTGVIVLTLLLVAVFVASTNNKGEALSVTDKAYINTQSVVIEYDYSRLTHATCKTDTECEFADAMEFYNDMRNDSYRWQAYQDTHYWLTQTSIPVLEPVECDKGDKKCEASNKASAGKPAHYPTICEPFINW